ncbi:N-acetylglucosamine kinase [Gimesia panareensis]|uniref:BadF/BadG/BcrA/BcrD ATPase family protein n=1 Tax=Gimesia panareensis TaxID=2527978 RepID=A0A517Q0J3_9PLAN|nr:BadF/BadG/BcrA/BcrD ATPase family protein [Gimesia panareensis]QDT25142.1 BadF/BadG/BcrA/BcrD ATPase family protein [Gimesia panareensis]QDU48107.1 BadF/BadG/BcrA/BcrD ATPase family protein [Gimesia panareensis]
MTSLHSRQLVLGIDGGGSKTTAALAVVSDDHEFHVVGRGTAGASNLNAVGLEAAAIELKLAIERAFQSAGAKEHQAAVLCMGMSGAGRPTEQNAWAEWAVQNQIADEVVVVTDAETVLAAGTPQGTGVALIAGTGSLAFGKDATGTEVRAGGWGYLLGDEGGGYQLAIAAIKAVLKAVDGRGPETLLQSRILQALGLTASEELIGYVYQDPGDRSEVARLSRLVFAAAAEDDPVARSILEQGVNELAELVLAVARRLHFKADEYALALTGGILLHQRDYRVSLLERLANEQLAPLAVECVDDPSLGAIRIAVRLLG